MASGMKAAHAEASGEHRADLELARRCAAGDEKAQRHLFASYKGKVHATLYRILGSNRDMEDLVQDAFLETFRSLDRFRGEALLSTWISRITSRVAFAYLSRKKNTAAPLDLVPETESAGPNPDSQVSAREATRRLYAALDRVEAKQRIAFALHVIDGRSMKEVAEITGATLVATKSRVWRARREIEKRARRDPLLENYLVGQETTA